MTSTDKPESEGENGNGTAVEQQPSDLEQKIIKQIEFYFGDVNLPRDKFMLEQIKLDEGWIPMSIMLKFQRLAKLSDDPKVILNALKLSQLIEVDSSGADPKIRRSSENPLPELNEERRKEIMSRTVYIKGFPKDAELDDVVAVISKFGPFDHVQMRRYKDTITQKYLFKGSVFVTFPSREKGQAFLDAESISAGETKLEKLWQEEYLTAKKKELQEKAAKSKSQKKGKETPADPVTVKGSVIHMAGDFLTLTREDIKEAVEKLDLKPVYIGFNKEDKDAYIRFAEENSAIDNLKKIGEEFSIGEAKLTVKVLEGDDELKYWKDKATQDQNRGNKRSRKNGSWKPRGGKRQRRN